MGGAGMTATVKPSVSLFRLTSKPNPTWPKVWSVLRNWPVLIDLNQLCTESPVCTKTVRFARKVSSGIALGKAERETPMTEQKEVYIVVYLSGGGDCGLGHCRFLENEEQARRLLDSVGHLMLVKGTVIGETTQARWEAE